MKRLRNKLYNVLRRFRGLKEPFPNGHYFSPYPELNDIKKHETRIFGRRETALPEIDLNAEAQLRLLDSFKEYYDTLPFTDDRKEGLRYHYINPAYSYSDGIFLYCMIRHVRPRKVVEIGCGYSSCVTLDTNELHFNNEISCTFIDPYPELLYSLINDDDRRRIEIIPQRLQDVDLDVFRALGDGDILFIDSTHVSKVDSDVNRIFFEILPSLKSGVYIHFHDVFFPFEYPKQWVYEGRAWTELYMLRAFLEYNNAYEIVAFNTMLESLYRERFERDFPLCLKNTGGSIWLKKL